jgi:hypothetical protein
LQIARVAERYARRTPLLAALIADIGVVLSGRSGAVVLPRWR